MRCGQIENVIRAVLSTAVTRQTLPLLEWADRGWVNHTLCSLRCRVAYYGSLDVSQLTWSLSR